MTLIHVLKLVLLENSLLKYSTSYSFYLTIIRWSSDPFRFFQDLRSILQPILTWAPLKKWEVLHYFNLGYLGNGAPDFLSPHRIFPMSWRLDQSRNSHGVEILISLFRATLPYFWKSTSCISLANSQACQKWPSSIGSFRLKISQD